MQTTKLHPFVGTILLCVHGTFYYPFIHSSIDGHLGWLCNSSCGQCCSVRVNVSWVIRLSADCIVCLSWSLHWYLKIHSLLGEWSVVILPCSVGFFPTLMRIYFAVQLTWLNLFFLAYVLGNMSEEKLRSFFFQDFL